MIQNIEDYKHLFCLLFSEASAEHHRSIELVTEMCAMCLVDRIASKPKQHQHCSVLKTMCYCGNETLPAESIMTKRSGTVLIAAFTIILLQVIHCHTRFSKEQNQANHMCA
jgi:hypothetical protein